MSHHHPGEIMMAISAATTIQEVTLLSNFLPYVSKTYSTVLANAAAVRIKELTDAKVC